MTPIKDRPLALAGHTISLDTHCGKLYVTINRDPVTGKPAEVFCRFGKAGGCSSAVMDGMTRMISYGLRSGMPAEQVVKGLSGIACHQGPATCMDALAKGVGIILASIATGEDPNRVLTGSDQRD